VGLQAPSLGGNDDIRRRGFARQEHRNIEKLLRVLERELSVFDRGDRPNYEAVLGVIDYFKDYPNSCHHPKEDIIFEKLKSRDPVAAANIGDLRAEHEGEARRLRRVAQAVERVLGDQDLLRESVDKIIRDFIDRERQHMEMEERIFFPAPRSTYCGQKTGQISP